MECIIPKCQYSTGTIKMAYIVIYDKFLENTTWLLNARRNFSTEKEAIDFARDCEHSAYTENVKMYKL